MCGRTRLRLCTALVSVLLLLACLGNAEVFAAKKLVFRLGHIQPPNHPEHSVFELFANRLSELSGGTIKVEIYHSGVLGDERELMEQLQTGTIDFARVTAAVLTSLSPMYQLADLPFMFSGADDMLKVVNSDQWKNTAEAALIKKGVRPIGNFWGGVRDLYTKRPVTTLNDLKGMKIRTMETPVLLEVWKALGAIPTPISWGELFTALQTGIVDGGEGSPVSYYANAFYEVAPYLASIQYMQVYMPFCISEKTWQSLSPEHQAIVLKAAAEATQKCRDVFSASVEKVYGDVAAKGGKVVRPTDLKDWQRRATTVYDDVAQKIGPDAVKLLEWMLAR